MPFVTLADGLQIYYELHGGCGPALFCGPPLGATEVEQPPLTRGFVEDLARDYRVLVMDYPYGSGRSAVSTPEVTSVARVTQDMLAVADAAGFEQFAWFGYSWGAVMGLQLAQRSRRLSALIAAGFPPVGAPYPLLLETCRRLVELPPPGSDPVHLRQFVRFYEDLQAYDDRAALDRIRTPCMAFVGDGDSIDIGAGPIPIFALVAGSRAQLEAKGWVVHILRGEDHSTAVRAELAVPLIRGFLDPMLLPRQGQPR